MDTIYDDFDRAMQQNLPEIVQKHIKSRLAKCGVENPEDRSIEDLWEILNGFIDDIFEEFNRNAVASQQSLLGKLKTECRHFFEILFAKTEKEKKECGDQVKNVDIEACADALFKRVSKQIVQEQYQDIAFDEVADTSNAADILSSSADNEIFSSLRLVHVLHSYGLCEKPQNDSGECCQSQKNDGNEVIESAAQEFVKLLTAEESVSRFVIQALDSPLYSEEEKTLEKLAAADIFCNQLPQDEIRKNPDLAILKAAYYAFCQVYELKCTIQIVRCEALLKELES